MVSMISENTIYDLKNGIVEDLKQNKINLNYLQTFMNYIGKIYIPELEKNWVTTGGKQEINKIKELFDDLESYLKNISENTKSLNTNDIIIITETEVLDVS